jgi:dTDP-glucose 4,6-dehydratase
MKTILVTGGAGFIGSNFIPYFLDKYENYRVANLDKLTYAGNLSNLEEVVDHPRYLFIRGDCADRDLVTGIFREHDIKGVVHFAAESHVDNSITGPEVFIESNVRGTFMLLEIARRSWLDEPHVRKAGYERCRFHHISTDEVYGSLGKTGLFTEDSPYAPNSPYSASKASADMIVRSYYHTYGLNTVMTNCSNNYGPKQHGEKLIPTIIRKALALEKIPIYGDGRNVRDWLYVLDHCRAIDIVYHLGEEGEAYNIGARNERENLEVANLICGILDKIAPENRQKSGMRSYSDLIELVKDRPGHDRRYAMDPTKIETKLGWRPLQEFERGMLATVEWYLKGSATR